MADDVAWPLAEHFCRTGYADLPTGSVKSVNAAAATAKLFINTRLTVYRHAP